MNRHTRVDAGGIIIMDNLPYGMNARCDGVFEVI